MVGSLSVDAVMRVMHYLIDIPRFYFGSINVLVLFYFTVFFYSYKENLINDLILSYVRHF